MGKKGKFFTGRSRVHSSAHLLGGMKKKGEEGGGKGEEEGGKGGSGITVCHIFFINIPS